MKRAARLTDQITTAVAASMAENKCDLAAMYNLLLSPGSAQEMVAAGVASCGIALPSLSPTKMYTEAGDLGPGLNLGTRAAQGGRRHTMGPASHPLPGLQSPPPQFRLLHHKEILPQINLPLHEEPEPAARPALARAHGPPRLRLRRVLITDAREVAECVAAASDAPMQLYKKIMAFFGYNTSRAYYFSLCLKSSSDLFEICYII